jgi:hypothetical protein
MSLALVYVIAIQQAFPFNPVTQTTGPFGVTKTSPNDTSFDFSWTANKELPSSMVINQGSGGLLSISFTYPQIFAADIIATAGEPQSAAIIETNLPSNIVGATVCTGKVSGGTSVIAGVKFVYENGMSNYFHGGSIRASSVQCVDATPTTPGYYLQSLSGSHDIYLKQLSFYWVSKDMRACYNDRTCEQWVDFCEANCCYTKYFDGQSWQTQYDCAYA